MGIKHVLVSPAQLCSVSINTCPVTLQHLPAPTLYHLHVSASLPPLKKVYFRSLGVHPNPLVQENPLLPKPLSKLFEQVFIT